MPLKKPLHSFSLMLVNTKKQQLSTGITWENLKYEKVLSCNNTANNTTVLCNSFPMIACWGDLILSEFQNQFCTCSSQPGQKLESGLLFNSKMPTPFRVRDYVLLRGTCRGYIECLNKYNNVTVLFIVGRNKKIVTLNQCCQALIVDGTESRFGHPRTISSTLNQHTLIIISSQITQAE